MYICKGDHWIYSGSLSFTTVSTGNTLHSTQNFATTNPRSSRAFKPSGALQLRSCSSISCASEFDAGGAFSGDGYGEVMAGNTPHWLTQIFNSKVKARIKQLSPKRPSCVGFYVVLSLGGHPYHIVAC
jgi:hypothetical protein